MKNYAKLTQRGFSSFFSTLLIICLLLLSANLTANDSRLLGAMISNPDQGSPVEINVCNGPSTGGIILQFTADGDATINFTMPAGVTYEAGSLALVSSNAGLTVTEASANPSAPSFTVTGVATGNNIQFSYGVAANCGSAPGGVDIAVDVDVIGTTNNGRRYGNDYSPGRNERRYGVLFHRCCRPDRQW